MAAFEAAIYSKLKYELQRCAADPPDPRFRQIVSLRTVRPPRIQPDARIRPPAATALNALYSNQARTGMLLGAFVTSLERAQGAARAEKEVWARRQTLAAADFAARAADALSANRRLRTEAKQALQATGFRAPSLTRADIVRAKATIASRGLPAPLVTLARRLGLPNAELTNLRAHLQTVRPRDVAGPVPLAGAPNADRHSQALERQLRQFALRARSRPLRPA